MIRRFIPRFSASNYAATTNPRAIDRVKVGIKDISNSYKSSKDRIAKSRAIINSVLGYVELMALSQDIALLGSSYLIRDRTMFSYLYACSLTLAFPEDLRAYLGTRR
jgi:hypothetical protein